MEEVNAVVLQLSAGHRRKQSPARLEFKPLAFRTSVGTLFPSESRATLIRNRNPMKYLSPSLFPIYLGYSIFL